MVQLFLFSAGGLKCAIPLAGIQSVVQMMDFTPSAGPGRGYAGAVNLHGRILPVCPMGELLGAPARPPRLTDMLVVTCAGEEAVALWIDGTGGVGEPDLSADTSSQKDGHPPLPDYLQITKNGLVVIADLAAFLARAQHPDFSHIIGVLRERAEITLAQQAEEPDADAVHAILAERAAKMVQPSAGVRETDLTEILRFHLAYQEYAVEMRYVREVILTGEITPVPGTPDFISGICAARGQIISLVDLRALFQIPEKGLTDLNRVIVMTDGSITFGILADSISGVGTIDMNQVTAPPPGVLRDGRRYLMGVMDENVYVLNGAAILGDPGIIIDDA